MPSFPGYRSRRLRRTGALRALVRETALEPGKLIAPLFVTQADGREPITSMPGVARLSLAAAAEDAKRLVSLGVGGVLLLLRAFGAVLAGFRLTRVAL